MPCRQPLVYASATLVAERVDVPPHGHVPPHGCIRAPFTTLSTAFFGP
jgi:hypothetical protein